MSERSQSEGDALHYSHPDPYLGRIKIKNSDKKPMPTSMTQDAIERLRAADEWLSGLAALFAQRHNFTESIVHAKRAEQIAADLRTLLAALDGDEVSEAAQVEGAHAYHAWRKENDPEGTGKNTREMCSAIYLAMRSAALKAIR